MSDLCNFTIVITTYNGSKYIMELLDSIRHQTIKPMEVIILDDCSTDNTQDVILKYIEKYSLDTWNFISNESNKGWRKNFFQGFLRAKGEFVFPCDQDDVWKKDKCETMVKIMIDNPQIAVLASGYEIFYSETDNAKNSYGKGIEADGQLVAVPMDEKWCHVKRPGCTFCFRKDYFIKLKEKWNVNYAHDAILWRNACVEHSLYIINKPLIRFRRHGNNATSLIKTNRTNRIEAVDEYYSFYNTLKSKVASADLRVIKKGIKWLELRRELLVDRKILLWPIIFFRYRKFYMSLRGCIGDLLLSLKDEI